MHSFWQMSSFFCRAWYSAIGIVAYNGVALWFGKRWCLSMGIGVLETWKVTVIACKADCELAVFFAILLEAAFAACRVFAVFLVEVSHTHSPLGVSAS